MSEATKKATPCGVFTVGNYFTAEWDMCPLSYGKVLELGFSGLIKLIVETMEKLDQNDPDYVKREPFMNR